MTVPAEQQQSQQHNGNGQPQQSQRRSANAFLRPRTHIVETGDGYTLQVELPGVNKHGLEITVENGELTIVGRREPFQTEAELVYRESRTADFRRAFELDPSIDTTRIAARLEQGVLTLDLPKAEAAKPRRIEVAVA
ncbi:MAG: Hsp20/alpha crystallin family protein [Verrucomicrobia bacterium]|nr:Hsp20/alpha crystallin family protein [Verrucomicrobiota bacterium]MBV9656692.1 Hsp20/alpha crystallin family protein [Verrucomicrobiota bacterium]